MSFTDIDECTDAALNAVDLCENDTNTQCSNNEGSFECVCVPGYSRTNGTCQRKLICYKHACACDVGMQESEDNFQDGGFLQQGR